jgi:NAD(P) transhydrogenase subunit alpha
MPMLFVPKDTTPDETRVAVSPDSIKKLVKLGYQVHVEAGAGEKSFIPDAAMTAAGATLGGDVAALYGAADVILKLHAPRPHAALGKHEAELMKPGALLVSFLYPYNNPEAVDRLRERKITAFAMDQVPRITRAQSMDALSSQANIAGYKAVLLGADALGKLFPLLMTAAGTIPPARVVILGAGVAGLQAIATARRLGAVVEVSDIRAAVKEQVQSLGAKFIETEGAEDMQAAGGYAKEVSKEFLARQQETLARHIAAADVVITTAQVPGKKAPMLVPASMVQKMRPGSVIVDLAAEQGGNCELTESAKTVVKHGVTIIGTANIPGLVPLHASEVYAKNLLYVMEHLTKNGAVTLDFEDEITKGSVVVHAGDIRHAGVAETLKSGGRV